MILLPMPCEHCGSFPMPTEVCCDKCERVQKIDEFDGIILHFSSKDEMEDECDEDCKNCDNISESLSQCEFHFCDIKCLSEYVADPNNSDNFSTFEERGLALYCDFKSANLLFYALGRCDLSE